MEVSLADFQNSALLEELFDEYSAWYLELARTEGLLPRSISGVSPEGRQFILLIDDLELHHMARNKYLRFVLATTGSVVYAYGGLALRGDSGQGEIVEVLDVVAADAGHYRIGHWAVERGEDGSLQALRHLATNCGDDPEKQPGAWFLAGALRFSESEAAKYGELWECARQQAMFSDRNCDTA